MCFSSLLTKVGNMQEFIQETKHRDHQVETDDDLKHVAKKFLCTQIPKFVPWQDVYPFVADDMNSIHHRAPHSLSNYAEFKHIDPTFLASLLNGVSIPKVESTMFKHYTNAIKPPPEKELLSFFAHGQLQKNIHSHVEHLTDDIVEQKRLIKAIREYVPLQLDRREMAIDVGNFLCALDVNIGQLETEERSQTPPPPTESLPKVDEDPVLTHVNAKQWEEEPSWRNDILNSFKINHGLPAHFSSQKVSKQILLAERCPSKEMLKPLMGKFQDKIDLTTITEKTGLINIVVDHLPDDNVKKICETQQAKTFYKSLKIDQRPTANRDLIRLMLSPDQTFPLDKEIINLLF